MTGGTPHALTAVPQTNKLCSGKYTACITTLHSAVHATWECVTLIELRLRKINRILTGKVIDLQCNAHP